MMPAGSF